MTTWQEVIEEKINADVNSAILEWRQDAYLTLDDWDEDNRLRVRMRIPDFDDGLEDQSLPREALIDLVRDHLRSMTPAWDLDGNRTDEHLLNEKPGSQWDEAEKLKLSCAQALLRILIAYEEAIDG